MRSSSETQITVRRFDPEALLSDDVANREPMMQYMLMTCMGIGFWIMLLM